MKEVKYIFGPVPSRRLGRSLGISPIPKKACNYSCIFCQLGRTHNMTNTRQEFFPVEDILAELDEYLAGSDEFDVISLVGEGEPTLYLKLGELIRGIKERTEKPVVVITNGALLSDPEVREELMDADIVMPSLDSVNEEMFKKTDRPYGKIKYEEVSEGLVKFSHEYKGLLFLEIMLMDGINDDRETLLQFKDLLKNIRYDKIYINTPVRPPAEDDVNMSSPEAIDMAVELLGGISIDALAAGSFGSEIADDYEAILSIIGRHPMNQFEIGGFLDSRENADAESIFKRLSEDPAVDLAEYKGYVTYRKK